ncbi:MAG TPA: hypothetical protein VJ302_22620 [Blastocatellia bacterium]|nr:hypothetical protein [Blastocatellia bacterium]
MAGLKFTLDASIPLTEKPLGHDDVPVRLVGATVNYEGEQKLEGVSFSFGSETSSRIEAFNAPSDLDEDGILGLPREDGAPPLVLTKEQAWLKYRVATTAKVSATAGVAPIGLKVDGQAGIVFTDFHVHDRSESTRSAIERDLPRLRFAGNPDDVLRLGAQEALSYQVRGELSSAVKLNWSDLFTTNLNALSRFLKGGEVLALEIGGNVSFNVGVVDDFRVVFLKGGSGKTRVSVRKANNRQLGLRASFGVTVGLADQQAVGRAVNNLIRSIAGEELSVIEGLISRASLAELAEHERQLVVWLFERLGLRAAEQPWNVLQARWHELKERVGQAISLTAQARVAAGFKYDYLRTRSDETLLEFELDEERLRHFHNDLMLCETRHLLQWAEQHPGADALKKYLHHQQLVRSQAWGFTLGIGPWIKIGGLDTRRLASVVDEDRRNGRRRIAYHGLRSYRGSGFSDTDAWTSDFKAEMPEFSAAAEPTAAEFEYGLHFRFEWEEKKLREDELERYVDHGIIWRALNAGHLTEVKERVGARLGKKATVCAELKFDDETLRRLLPLAAAADDAAGARALAKAMPYWSLFEARRNPRFRELCYRPLWEFYFKNDDWDPAHYGAVAAETIRKFTEIPDHQLLSTHEKGMGSLPVYQNLNTFAGQVYFNGGGAGSQSGVHDAWRSFLDGLRRLNTALAPGAGVSHRELEPIFAGLSKFWSQSLFVRAAGIFLLELASSAGDRLARVERTLTIRQGGSDEAVIFSSSVR